jgi:hypothetical protein
MENYTCDNCGKSVDILDKDSHEMSCNNAFRMEEFANLIPCEFCEQLIDIEEYQTHIMNCYSIPELNMPNFNSAVNFNSALDINSAVNFNSALDINSMPDLNSLLELLNSGEFPFPPTLFNNSSYSELTNIGNEIGNVEIGIDNIYNYLIPQTNIGFKCPVCYEKKNETFIAKCQHEFCMACTNEWFKNNKKCPICMNELDKLV